jgi:hypothetical protein
VNQSGHPVDLVKLSDALLAVPKNELSIFSESVTRRHLIDRKKQGGVVASPPERKQSKAAEPAPVNPTADARDTNVRLTDWQPRAAAWIAATLEAAPTLPPLLRTNGLQLLREIGASTLVCGVSAFDALNSVSQFNALLRMLKSRVSSGPPEVGAERE